MTAEGICTRNFQPFKILNAPCIFFCYGICLPFVSYVVEKEAATTTKELIGSLISPVLDVIVKAHTHPYLSKTTVNNALELLVLALRELPATITPLGNF